MAILLSHLSSAVIHVLAAKATASVSSLPTSTIVPSSIITTTSTKSTSPTSLTAESTDTTPRTTSSSPSVPSETRSSSTTSVSSIVSINVSPNVSITSTLTPITTTSLSQIPATTLSSTTNPSSTSNSDSFSALVVTSTSLTPSATSSQSMAPTTPSSSAASSISSANPSSEAQAGNGPSNHVAAIVVATILGTAVFLTVAYLIFRYCPPVAKRWEALKEQRSKLRTYREGIDDRKTPSGEGGVNKNRRSFLARNWYWNGTQRDTTDDQRAGLGLGPVTALRDQAQVETVQHPPQRAIRQSEIGMAIS